MKKGALKKIGLLVLVTAMIYLAVLFLLEIPDIHATDVDMILGAHRGSSMEYTENTLEAIQAALNDPKYEFIEFDVQYTKDKKAILYHDATLRRLNSNSGKVAEMTYEEIQNISDFYIPQFEEVIELIGNQKKLNIEIKSTLEEGKKLTDYVVSYCENKGILQNVLISAISEEIVKYVSEKYPEIKTGVIYWIIPQTYLHSEKSVKKLYERVGEIGADYVMLHGRNIRNEGFLELKPENQILVFWYFTDEMMIMQGDGMW